MMSCDDERAFDVLDYWFGGDQQISYNTKWFPDGHVQSATDLEITTRYEGLLVSALSGALSHWKDSAESSLALIVVLDQFSRHIYRHKGASSTDPQRRLSDDLALSTAIHLHETQTAHVQAFPMAQFIFSFMPFRHNPTGKQLYPTHSRKI